MAMSTCLACRLPGNFLTCPSCGRSDLVIQDEDFPEKKPSLPPPPPIERGKPDEEIDAETRRQIDLHQWVLEKIELEGEDPFF